MRMIRIEREEEHSLAARKNPSKRNYYGLEGRGMRMSEERTSPIFTRLDRHGGQGVETKGSSSSHVGSPFINGFSLFVGLSLTSGKCCSDGKHECGGKKKKEVLKIFDRRKSGASPDNIEEKVREVR